METFTFKAEINELMNMIIHNFYSNKDIFLRELISNASDAINKLKYNSLTDSSLLGDNHDFEIKVSLNKDNKTVIIEDTGIGMSKDDLINNIGTIAKSGTKEFIKNITEKSSGNNLIGQFGVGFYSAFLIADRVSVKTRHAGSDETFEWVSNATGSFNITKLENTPDFTRGTKITLYVKDTDTEYLEDFKIKEIVKKHSSYITYPIFLQKFVKEEPVQKETEQQTEQSEEPVQQTEQSEEHVQQTEQTEEPEQQTEQREEPVQQTEQTEQTGQTEQSEEPEQQTEKPEKQTEQEDGVEETKEPEPVYKETWEKINSEPIWVKTSDEITEKEHEDFYKSLSNDWETYLTHKHFKVEGNYEFTGLLYIPKRAPFDLFDRKKNGSSIKLYVKKVLISDDCKELYPEWLSFVKGIVDSQDLPLNASRELLQQSKIIKQINKTLTNKTLDMISGLTDDKDKYKEFYTNFDKNLKLGICEDSQQATKDKLIKLLRFTTSKGEFVSFEEYKNRMKEDQTGIYYITGESLKHVENSPFVDKLKRFDYEVIYMTDAIDEYTLQNIQSFDDVKLINVTKDDLKLKEDEKVDEEQYKPLCEKIQKVLKDRIEKVCVSTKIETQPAIITNPMGMSANMERIMKAQALANNNANPMYGMMLNKRNLEINPTHPVIQKISQALESSEENVSDETSNLVNLVCDCALLAGGYQLSDINEYLKNVYKLM